MTPELRYVKEWAKKAREATTARDEWVMRARERGHSWREIGDAAGMSHMAIKKIVERG